MDMEKQFDMLERRRFAAEARAVDRIDQALDAADYLVGELCREGKTVHYINQRNAAGKPNGRIIEGTRLDLVGFILRNPRYLAYAC